MPYCISSRKKETHQCVVCKVVNRLAIINSDQHLRQGISKIKPFETRLKRLSNFNAAQKINDWWLLNDCLMTAWWLPDDYLMTVWWRTDDCLMTLLQLTLLMIVSQMPGNKIVICNKLNINNEKKIKVS